MNKSKMSKALYQTAVPFSLRNIDGRRVQRIKIVYNCIGEFNPSVSTSAPEQEKSA
jgi:hypothetical protein